MPLASAEASLALVGGKGRSLAKLAVAGLPVPTGFLLSTGAYEDFVAVNNLQESILHIVSDASLGQAASLEAASARVRSLFEAASLPSATAEMIARAYVALGEDEPPVAVRSSATAEDLPDLSFAGQQDTFLNVRGRAALLAAIRGCWASLWTARAIGYRMQMDIDAGTVAMGVVVQVMVPADISGILFTANPANGERSELVVNASFGLGEAVVGGHVTPDTYVLDRSSFEIKKTMIGTKERMIVSAGEQGTATAARTCRQTPRIVALDGDAKSTGHLEQASGTALRRRTARHRMGRGGWRGSGCCNHGRSQTCLLLRCKMFAWDPPAKGADSDQAASRRKHARTALAVV